MQDYNLYYILVAFTDPETHLLSVDSFEIKTIPCSTELHLPNYLIGPVVSSHQFEPVVLLPV